MTTIDRLDPAALRALLDAGRAPRLIDVRAPEEFRAAHIPGSQNVPVEWLGQVPAWALAGEDEERGVVLICRTGQRAAEAGRRLTDEGLPGVRVLDGGIRAWRGSGAPVARGRWPIERQVRLVAGGIVLAAVLTSIWVPAAKWVAGFIGAGLTFAALSNTCAMGALLARLPVNRAAATGAPRGAGGPATNG